MFFRAKRSGSRTYVQIVENRWEGGATRQRVIATLGRLDALQVSGQLEALLESGARFAEALMVVSAHREGTAPAARSLEIGPALVFERLWEQTGCRRAIEERLRGRKFGFPVERALFLEVLHRLFDPGSDRGCHLRWRQHVRVEGIEGLDLHHTYRAMAWLGEPLEKGQQEGATPFAPRCTKDLVEEALFHQRRDLFSCLDLVFFDTTSIYFEGEGGATLGRRGNSKDHRPDLKQMVVGVVLDDKGRPLCCELWPGNTTDVRTLIPVVDRLRKRFHVGRVCVVADRGMISKETVAELEDPSRDWLYILGARLRSDKEVARKVLSRPGRYREVVPDRSYATDPSPLKVKEVWVGDRRYIVCLNEEQARKDAADREALLDSLQQQLRHGAKSLVGNKGYRKFLKAQGESFTIDEDRIAAEARLDGKWVLRTNAELAAAEVAVKYKQLWTVEDIIRSMKSLLESRPVFHTRDETIRGHVFCSYLALVLRKELQDRLEAKGDSDVEWAQALSDLESLQEIEILHQGKRFALHTETRGAAGKLLHAAGVALPPTVRQLTPAPG
jgi:transposase